MSDKHDIRIILTDTKLSFHVNIKDDTNKQHKHDFVYSSRCRSTDCTDSYIGEAARRLSERIIDHSGRDTKSYIVRHCLNSIHGTLNIENFKVLNMGYSNDTYKRRISEALFVKQYIALPSMCKTTLSLCSFLIDFDCVSIATLQIISIF